MKRALPCLAVAAVFGCGGATAAFTRTGPTLPPQPASCEFAVVSTPPKEPVTELGTIQLKYVTQTDWIFEESAFKRKVRNTVCQSGGELVVPHINDNGLYMSATVLTTKSVPAPAAAPSAPAPSEPETTSEMDAPAAPAPEKSAATAPAPEAKGSAAKAEAPAAAPAGKRPKKGATAKKDEDVRGKDGKIDIDKLL